MIDFQIIKLVIWDLDETFWKGILSEGTAQFVDENGQLIRDMTDAGVINSICSKNDPKQVKEYLSEHGLDEFFVFRSINWAPKGQRVLQIIKEMNLRAPNVLFIDDNPTNIGEALDACPGLLVSDESVIPRLRDYYSTTPKKDPAHKRLKQYKVLEEKQRFRAKSESNEDFLRKCNIQVVMKEDCENHLERITDLVQRSNQLNFTKVRSESEELLHLFRDESIKSGYVEVRDKFGDYGIVGFYALQGSRLLHFVFSCRTLGMGVEQYVYEQLGRPDLTVVGEVSSSLDGSCPDWINLQQIETASEKQSLKGKKILIKGPCDLQQMFSFIKETPNIITEFTYVNNRGVQIESGNHTVHVIESIRLTDEEKKHLERTLPFGDRGMFRTKMFDDDIGAVVFSMFTDPNLGLYKEKATGATVAFGEFTCDLTDPSNWDAVIAGDVFTANCSFKEKDLRDIQNRFEFIGRIAPDEIIEHLEMIYRNISKDAVLVLCLGSELPYESNCQLAYEDRHIYHRTMNRLIRDWAAQYERVYLLDVNKYVHEQSDFTNNINHFQKQVYFKLCEELIAVLDSGSDDALRFATEKDKRKEVLVRKIKKIPNKILRMMHGSK